MFIIDRHIGLFIKGVQALYLEEEKGLREVMKKYPKKRVAIIKYRKSKNDKIYFAPDLREEYKCLFYVIRAFIVIANLFRPLLRINRH